MFRLTTIHATLEAIFFFNRAVVQSYVKASLQQKLEKTVFVLFELR